MARLPQPSPPADPPEAGDGGGAEDLDLKDRLLIAIVGYAVERGGCTVKEVETAYRRVLVTLHYHPEILSGEWPTP